MAEIDSLGSGFYYAGVQNSQNSNEALKNKKAGQSEKSSRSRFSSLLKSQTESEVQVSSFDEVSETLKTMTVESAVVFLRDRVDAAGNDFSDQMTQENLEKFKDAVGQFIRYIVENNFEVTSRQSRRPQFVSPIGIFSNYNTKPHLKDPKVQITVINEKLDDLTRDMLNNQRNNLKILQQVNEIKGLVIDLLRA